MITVVHTGGYAVKHRGDINLQLSVYFNLLRAAVLQFLAHDIFRSSDKVT